MKDKLPVSIVNQAGIRTDNDDSMLTLKPDFSKSRQPSTQVDRIDLMALSLAAFSKAQTANAFCRLAARELGNARAESTINEEGVLL